MSITAILNIYRRPQYLQEQLLAIESQSIKPDNIFVWYNKPEGENFKNQNILKDYTVFYSTHNFKYHARFAAALLAETDYICIFDDDTIPGTDWFQSCLNTIEKTGPNLMVTRGISFRSKNNYKDSIRYGPHNHPVIKPQTVDIGGHSWFFPRDLASSFWRERIPSIHNGEDLFFSYAIQKYNNAKTIVPPHPVNNQSVWGSTKISYGDDTVASWKNNKQHYIQRTEILKELIRRGWKLQYEISS